MRGRQIEHVHVVAHARPVARRIVVAVDRHAVAAAGGGLQHDRDQVRLRIVPLAVPRARAGGIEIAQTHAAQPEGAAVPGDRALEGQLRLPVRVGRRGRVVLVDRLLARLAVDGGARGEHEQAHPRRAHRVEQRQAAHDVGAIVARGIAHRLGDERQAGQVDDALDPVLAQLAAQCGGVEHVGEHERHTIGDRVAVTADEAVVDDDRVPARQQRLGDHAADVAGASGHEHSHALTRDALRGWSQCAGRAAPSRGPRARRAGRSTSSAARARCRGRSDARARRARRRASR